MAKLIFNPGTRGKNSFRLDETKHKGRRKFLIASIALNIALALFIAAKHLI